LGVGKNSRRNYGPVPRGENPKVTVPVPSPFPWLDVIGLICGLVGVSFLIASYRKPRQPKAIVQEPPAVEASLPSAQKGEAPSLANAQPEPQSPYVDGCALVLRPSRDAWAVHVRFAKSGKNMKALLDLSVFSGGVGHGFWGRPQRALITRVPEFAKGQEISFTLAYLDPPGEERQFWRWALDGTGEKPPIAPTMARARLAFIAEDDSISYFLFIVLADDARQKDWTKPPFLVGENLFSYPREWQF
jgi:hypothetical protein